MNKQFECDGESTSARRLPRKILPAQCGRHVGVAKVIVNNNPETVKRRWRSFCTAAGWCFAPALMLRSVAARRERRRFHSPNALRCVSKHEGEPNHSSSSFETRARACKFAERLRHARSSG